VVNRPASRRLVFAVFVLLALGAIYAAAGLRHPASAAGQTASRTSRAPVVSALRACAAPGEAGPDAGSLALASVPGPAAPAGQATVTRLVAGGSASRGALVTTVTQPGALALTTVKAGAALPKNLLAGQPGSSADVRTSEGRGGVVISATGAMAQGLAVEQTGPAGLVTAQCGSPGTNFWFVGPGEAQAPDIELYLMNTDNVTADAQVTAITDVTKNGQPGDSADNSITVPPHSMVTQSLGTLLQSSRVMALNITTSVGRVVAAVRESKNGSAVGSWLPATETPARSLYIPGVPATGGTRELYIAVPGSATAQVKVTVVTSRGSYQPTGGTNIPLLEDSATVVALPSLGYVGGAVKVSSTVPVVAAMLTGGGPSGAAGAVAASAGPVEEQGVLADGPVGAGGTTDLVLSAPGAAASVRVTVAALGLPVSSQSGTVVTVGARSSVIVPVKNPGGRRVDTVMVVVTPLAGSGPVYAGRVISYRGVVQSIMPVPSSLTWVGMPAVPTSLAGVAP
jgi:Family of unknown function (DUF5719)